MPAAANRAAMARPMPLAPPVTTATLSRNSCIGSLPRPRRDRQGSVPQGAAPDLWSRSVKYLLTERDRIMVVGS